MHNSRFPEPAHACNHYLPLPRGGHCRRSHLSGDQGCSRPLGLEWKCPSWLQLKALQRPSRSPRQALALQGTADISLSDRPHTNGGPGPGSPLLSSLPRSMSEREHVVSSSLAPNPEESTVTACSGVCSSHTTFSSVMVKMDETLQVLGAGITWTMTQLPPSLAFCTQQTEAQLMTGDKDSGRPASQGEQRLEQSQRSIK